MTLRDLEREILAELKTITNNPKLKLKDMMEWQTGRNLKAEEGETVFYLPKLQISVAVRTSLVTATKKENTKDG